MNPTPPTIDAPERREAVESVRDAALALVVRSRLSLATEVIKLRRALLAASSGERGAVARFGKYAEWWNSLTDAARHRIIRREHEINEDIFNAGWDAALATPATVEEPKV